MVFRAPSTARRLAAFAPHLVVASLHSTLRHVDAATYISVEPPDRVVFTWGIPGNAAFPPGTSTVEILLKADGDETIVELAHRNLPSELRPSHREGGEESLEVLRKSLKS